MPGRDLPDAAQAATGRARVPLQDAAEVIAEEQVAGTDDARAYRAVTIAAAVAHGGCTGGELHLADGALRLGAMLAIHRAAFHEHGRANAVAGAQIAEEIQEQIAVVGPVPEVVMGIDDEAFGLQHRLVVESEPRGAHGVVRALILCVDAHGIDPSNPSAWHLPYRL